MMCTLVAMTLDLASVQDQLLASLTIPTLQEVSSRLLCVTSIPPPRATVGDSSILVSSHVQHSPREEQGSDHGTNQAPHPKCTYCHK